MTVDISQLIVHVKETPHTLVSSGHRPVARQDVFVKLKM